MEVDRRKYDGYEYEIGAIIPGLGWVCPLCVDHEQGSPSEYKRCYNIRVNKYSKTQQGACACCGPKHGKR